MKRITLTILTLFSALVMSAQDFTKVVECGTWVTFYALPFDQFIFSHWSDGSTDSVRTIEVTEDMTFVAYFRDKCGDYAELPLVNRYDWILMLNVRKIVEEMHYDISPERVRWYRAVGKVDSLDNPDENDPEDAYLGEGYSFTLDKNLQQTGIYYALVELNSDSNLYCSGLARSELASFVAPEPTRQVRLLPNTATPNGTMYLVGLNPDITTEIRIYSATGKLLANTSTIGVEKYLLTAYPVTGVYEVQVLSNEDNLVLRYLVKQ